MARVRKLGWSVAAALMIAAHPAVAEVKAGVDAWSRGDYAQAVREWQAPAEAGDADALFNLGQAYRLGRGVPADEARAEGYYARAAAKGHVQAADTYGLMLFQSGRREMALPYVEEAARRGDPRSQYLLGIAHFNGDLVPRDWVRAYALLTLATSAGLPQAAPALAQMDEYVSLADRQQAAGIAETMRREADSTRGRELAASELAMGPGAGITAPPLPPSLSRAAAAPTPTPSQRIPQPIPQVEVSPSIAAARAAVAEATRVTGTENPAYAGADFTFAAPPPPASGANVRRPAPASSPPSAPAPVPPAPAPVQARQPAAPPPASASPPAPSRGAAGPWRVQLGAFSVAGNAERLWASLSRRPELAGRTRLLVPAGRVTKLQAGGFATQGEADAACRALKSSGQDCLVTTR